VYHYIYESFLTDPKFAKQLSAIENRLTDLGIYGSVHRLALFKTMKGTVQDAVRRGAKTVVVVGDDGAVAKAIDAIAEFPGVVFGVIPVGDKNSIARILGIDDALGACDILSARLVEELDLGKVNKHYFLTSLNISGAVKAECDGRYTVSPVNGGEICISNFSMDEKGPGDPRDGRLETMVKTSSKGFFRSIFGSSRTSSGLSVFPTTRIVVRSPEGAQMTAIADGQPLQDAEFNVEIAPRRLTVIVGKGRAIN
jgi:diacylglycerol kinase family enzyme